MQQEVTVSVNAQKEVKNLPAKRFRAGPISATVWENTTDKDGETRSYYTISLDRSYKDAEDNWQHTNSLRVSDLPRAELVLRKAYEWLALEN